MSDQGPVTDDRPERFAAAQTPEERAAVLGFDYGVLRRVGLRSFVFLLVTAAVVAFVGLTVLMMRPSEVDTGSILMGGIAGLIVALVPLAVSSVMSRAVMSRPDRDRWFDRLSIGIPVFGVLLLGIAVASVPAGTEGLLVLGVLSALGTGSVVNLQTPRGLATMMRQGSPLAVAAAEQVRGLPNWVIGIPGSVWPAITVVIDSFGWAASIVLFHTSPVWIVPAAAIMLLSGIAWMRATRSDRAVLGIGSSVVASALLVVAAILVS